MTIVSNYFMMRFGSTIGDVMKVLRFIVMLLMVIGSLNWGLVGFFQYNLVADLFGDMSGFTRFIYAIVGLAGLYGITYLCCCCKSCGCRSGCNCCKK